MGLHRKALMIKNRELINRYYKEQRAYILDVNIESPKESQKYNKLLFLVQGMQIGNLENLVPNLKRKKTYVVQI